MINTFDDREIFKKLNKMSNLKLLAYQNNATIIILNRMKQLVERENK